MLHKPRAIRAKRARGGGGGGGGGLRYDIYARSVLVARWITSNMYMGLFGWDSILDYIAS